jgi:hypothetical protein
MHRISDLLHRPSHAHALHRPSNLTLTSVIVVALIACVALTLGHDIKRYLRMMFM